MSRMTKVGLVRPFVAGAVVIAAGCLGPGTSPSPAPLTGSWGGDHIAMTISADSTHIELDCAHGDLTGSFALDAQGRFSLAGVFVREHGGPIREGEIPDSHPATYEGAVSGTRMTMTIRLSDLGETIGTFSLSRGAPGSIVKCL
jgi:hypothetical protein